MAGSLDSDTKRPKIAGMIDEKVTEIGLKVIPFNKRRKRSKIFYEPYTDLPFQPPSIAKTAAQRD